jgi:hypothetical protein
MCIKMYGGNSLPLIVNPTLPPVSDGLVRMLPQNTPITQQPYDTDAPTAPLQEPEENEPDPYQAPKRSSKHVIYAIELFIFTLVGWGWLALREFMGATPVMDISVLLCLLVSSAANLLLALIYYSTDQFRTASQGFLAHTLSVWVLYAYSLIESTGGSDSLCCSGESTYSVSKTYAAAYFGGLPFHQTAGAVTLAFLTVFIILAAGQARVCQEDPREWLTGSVTTSISCLVSVHLGMFAMNARVCGGVELGKVLYGFAIFAWLGMADVSDFLNCLQPIQRVLIQRGGELSFSVILIGLAGGVSSLAGRVSLPLMLIFGGIVLWQAVALGLAIDGWKRGKAPHPEVPPRKDALLSRFPGRNRPTMLLPGVKEMRLHRTKKERKAW